MRGAVVHSNYERMTHFNELLVLLWARVHCFVQWLSSASLKTTKLRWDRSINRCLSVRVCVCLLRNKKHCEWALHCAAVAESPSHWRVSSYYCYCGLSLPHSFSISNSLDSALITLIARFSRIHFHGVCVTNTNTSSHRAQTQSFCALCTFILCKRQPKMKWEYFSFLYLRFNFVFCFRSLDSLLTQSLLAGWLAELVCRHCFGNTIIISTSRI